ncbi:transglycosylase SLT domain-containing protein [Mesorhizobium sp. NBSH29]|uniref:lytic transglycosylase domain-containing protein n=1 Tax=Mesorhizobium sp. NBSH29 TaxID=2654249 RepID=UPI0018969FCD|nr:lytic transglycosylase domain-containing protein [Mesorhizobium sp. NBSH29]QPC85929.1 transglycosylase SLT domain-containing protein [Mesorhizobium sp. NBSH29]
MRIIPKAAVLLCGVIAFTPASAEPDSNVTTKPTVERICQLIETYADSQNLPREFFARLIWKESRFDATAVSPVGAEGIAQFMPGTAKMRGLSDPFDIEQAIPASAKYLGELKHGYGNLGLAAAAYNAGETRVSRWLKSGGFLPLETEDYVLDVMGEAADSFTKASYQGAVRALDPKRTFEEACRNLPIIMAATVPMSRIRIKPWGIQVAGNFRRQAAVRQWDILRKRFPGLLAGHSPVVSRIKSPRGRTGIYAVRIGAESRGEADVICRKLHTVGGACIVLRNR